jgi:hypothetical protein
MVTGKRWFFVENWLSRVNKYGLESCCYEWIMNYEYWYANETLHTSIILVKYLKLSLKLRMSRVLAVLIQSQIWTIWLCSYSDCISAYHASPPTVNLEINWEKYLSWLIASLQSAREDTSLHDYTKMINLIMQTAVLKQLVCMDILPDIYPIGSIPTSGVDNN